ncbi:MAG: cation:proton antiporter [Candidatus Woesearchaeota archaeon]
MGKQIGIEITGYIPLITLFLTIAVVSTVLGTTLAVMLSKGSFKEGFVVGWGLTPKGDVELVIIALALSTGIITQGIFSALVVMSLLTTIISPIIFKRLVVYYHFKRTGHLAKR